MVFKIVPDDSGDPIMLKQDGILMEDSLKIRVVRNNNVDVI